MLDDCFSLFFCSVSPIRPVKKLDWHLNGKKKKKKIKRSDRNFECR